MKCFTLSGDNQLYKKANAFFLKDEATKLLSHFESHEKRDFINIELKS